MSIHPAHIDPTPTDMGGLSAVIDRLDDGTKIEADPGYGDPGAISRDNNRRAGFASRGVLAYCDRTFGDPATCGEDFTTVIGDFLGDLMHLSDALDLDFYALVEKGRSHYLPELAGEF